MQLRTLLFYHWRRIWQSTPALLPGKSHGGRSLIGYSPWGRKESDTTSFNSHMSLVASILDSSAPDFRVFLIFVKSVSREAWGLRAICWQHVPQLRKENQSAQQRDLCSVLKQPGPVLSALQMENPRVIHHFSVNPSQLCLQSMSRIGPLPPLLLPSFSDHCPLISEKAMAPTPVLSPGKPHGRGSLVGCSPWGR